MANKKLTQNNFTDQSRAFQSAGGRLQGERPSIPKGLDPEMDKFRSYEMDDVDLGSESFGHERSGLKDQELHVQDLKKENFDLKLRLYMEQKNNETAKEKLTQYEAQLSQLLDKFDESTTYINKIEVEVKDGRFREKNLLTKQKKLELKCAEQDEAIHNLSMDVSRLQSTSMRNLTDSMAHSTPVRYTSSAMNIRPSSDEGVGTDLDNESHITSPERSYQADRSRLSNKRSSSRKSSNNDDYQDKSRSLNREGDSAYTTATVSNFYRSESMNGQAGMSLNPNQNQGKIAYVSPNNAQLVSPGNLPPPVTRKPKKKGLAKFFSCCAGKSSKSDRDEEYSRAPQPQVRY